MNSKLRRELRRPLDWWYVYFAVVFFVANPLITRDMVVGEPESYSECREVGEDYPEWFFDTNLERYSKVEDSD